MVWYWPSAALAISSLFLAGCDPASETASAAGIASESASIAEGSTPTALPRACTLVTGAEAQAVIGQPVAAMADEPDNCRGASAGYRGQFTFVMVNDRIGAQTQASGEAIANFGDAAWRSLSNADMIGARQLIVRKGLAILVLNVTGMRKDGAVDGFDARMEIAGRAALARMGSGS